MNKVQAFQAFRLKQNSPSRGAERQQLEKMKRNEDPSVCFAFGVAECGGSHHLTTHLWSGQTGCKRRTAAGFEDCGDGVEDYCTDDPLTVPRSLVTVAPPACFFRGGDFCFEMCSCTCGLDGLCATSLLADRTIGTVHLSNPSLDSRQHTVLHAASAAYTILGALKVSLTWTQFVQFTRIHTT